MHRAVNEMDERQSGAIAEMTEVLEAIARKVAKKGN